MLVVDQGQPPFLPPPTKFLSPVLNPCSLDFPFPPLLASGVWGTLPGSEAQLSITVVNPIDPPQISPIFPPFCRFRHFSPSTFPGQVQRFL